jgi:ribonuclease VapC
MIVLDSSAVLAILTGAPEAERLAEEIAYDGGAQMSVVNFAECAAAVQLRADMLGVLDRWLTLNRVALANLDRPLAVGAAQAFARYGETGLTLDDCFAYALAKKLDAPLLSANPAFAKTDVKLG